MRTKKGIITSAKMDGTVSVVIQRSKFHPIYKKRYRASKKFLADTGEFKDLQAGDTVVITECRPLSKRKCFRVTEVLEQAPRVSELKEEEGLEEAIHREKKAPPASITKKDKPQEEDASESKDDSPDKE